MWQEHHFGLTWTEDEPSLEGIDFYILLDGAALSALRLIYQHDDAPEIELLYRDTRHDAALEVSPVLYRLNESSRMWDVQEQWQPAALIIESREGMDALANHLRSLLSVKMPSGEFAYCRFYDPSLTERFCNNLTQDELDAWLGPISSLWVYSRGKWLRLAAPNPLSARLAEEEGWFSIHSEHLMQWQAQERQLFIQRMVMHFSGSGFHFGSNAELEKVIQQRTEQAGQFGISSEQHLLIFVELALQFSDSFDSPDILKQLTNTEESVEHRLAKVEARLLGLDG
ncbi:DUF4123 domain-containing protein [Stutzerimonas nitrititolerans]|uniref:DUF4123 domain-containing protein n=1 Tax=Stutzerimonas nitrititolerans TaxID=2482751 RepID=UPI0015E27902|nr:DUF4123 domain-containing protein [Stutzerimonas nitrititolerans]MBA1233300.1 DUF4123 domain-containing protein [Stutzerimonas stutzeri]